MNRTLIEPLHAAQLEAVDKLKRLRVGALYMDRQDGKMHTVSELVKYRIQKGKITGVMWLCTRRKVQLIQSGVEKYLVSDKDAIRIVGIESLSHSLKLFLDTLEQVSDGRKMLVLDNGLLIKNANALRTRRVMEIAEKCPYRLLVGDMPFTKNIADIFSQWFMLDWRILGYRSFYGFCINHVAQKGGSRNTDYIARAIEPFCAQIVRQDVQNTGRKREFVYRFELPEAAKQEYKRVADRFMRRAFFSNTGVYRMLQACQQVISGRRVVGDYPLKTENLYIKEEEDPRLNALLDVVSMYAGKRILILFKYKYEASKILKALSRRPGEAAASLYNRRMKNRTPIILMNIIQDEKEDFRLEVDAMIYYSNDWNWQKREEKERQCLNSVGNGTLDVISLAAADTMDINILKSVWKKENLLETMRKGLTLRLNHGEK